MELIFGKTLKSLTLIVVPAALVTDILPVVAPSGTIAFIELAETGMIPVEDTPLNLTSVTLDKLVPLIVTCVPIDPDKGVNDVMVGGLMTIKSVALTPVPSVVVMDIFPVIAVVGTVVMT
jgi:hypothetical protein